MKIDVSTLLLIGAIAFLAIRGCDAMPDPGPSDLTPREAAAESLADYQARLADEFERTAELVASGEVASDVEFAEIHDRTESIRREAFLPVARLAEELVPDGRWDDEQERQVEQFCRAVAAGFRE